MFLQKRFISYSKNFNYFKFNNEIIFKKEKNIERYKYDNNIIYSINDLANLTFVSLDNIEEKKDLTKLNAYLNYYKKYDNYIFINNQNLLVLFDNIHIFKKSKSLVLDNIDIKYYDLFNNILEKNIKISSITIDKKQTSLVNKLKNIIQDISNINFLNILSPIKIKNNNFYKINYFCDITPNLCNNIIKYKHNWKYYIYDISEENLYILCKFLYNIKYLQYNDEKYNFKKYNFIIYLKKFDHVKFAKYLKFLEVIN